jgi:hypothetical protein
LRRDKKNRLQDKEEKEIHQTKEIEGVDTLTSTRSEGSKETKIGGPLWLVVFGLFP